MSYNTGNPVPSKDPRDLKDNAESLDQAVNSDDSEFVDRRGNRRLTIQGMVDAATSGNPAVGAAQDAYRSADRAEQAADRAEAPASDWYLAANGVALDVVLDATSDAGVTLDGSGDVSAINNLGKAGVFSLAPTGGTNSPLVTIGGNRAVQFDGGATYQPYKGGGTYAGTVFSSTKKHFLVSAIAMASLTGDQAPFSVGVDSAGNPRLGLYSGSGGISKRAEYHDGTTLNEYAVGPLQSVANSLELIASFHNGVDEATLWSNGALLALKEPEATLAGQSSMTADTIYAGSIANGIRDLNGGLIAVGVDNNDSLTFDQAFAKYKRALNQFGKPQEDAFAIWTLGQSNAKGSFTNPAPLSFGAGEAYARRISPGYTELLERDGFTQGEATISGESCPGIWFADEWKKITGHTPIFQQLAFGGTPITPGLTGHNEYWAPKNSVGDAAGDTSYMETVKEQFERFRDLLKYSPEFRIANNIALIVEGEADAQAFNAGDSITQESLAQYMHSWLNALSSKYGIKTFAIVNIGRIGTDATEVSNNAPGVTLVRDSWSQVISERYDSYDVFPYLNHVPDPFVLDDLVVDSDGVWVSGVGSNPDGLHYTAEMYEAFGRAAARNLAQMLGV